MISKDYVPSMKPTIDARYGQIKITRDYEIAEPSPMPDEPRFYAEFGERSTGAGAWVIRDRCGNHEIHNIDDPALARIVARVMTRIHEEWAAKWKRTVEIYCDALLEMNEEVKRVKASIAKAENAL